MSKVFINEETLTAIGDAIRKKSGSANLIAPGNMADIILNLSSSSSGGEANHDIEDWILSGYYEGEAKTFDNYTNDRITKINGTAFQSLRVVELNLPNLTQVFDQYAFGNNTYLKTIILPKLQVGTNSMFANSSIRDIQIPELLAIRNNMFRNTNIQKLDLPKVSQISGVNFASASPFYVCNKLDTLILRNQELITAPIDALTGLFNNATLMKNGSGYIYVPQALIEDYKTATNWSSMANQFRAIEDYPDICGEV